MKSLFPLMVLLFAFVVEQSFSQTPQLTKNGVIEGTITRAGTAEPIPNAIVQLSIVLAARGVGVTPAETVLDTTTDEAGRFFFRDLYPGPYQLLYMRNSYLPISQGVEGNVELRGAIGSFRGDAAGGSRPGPGPGARGASQTVSFVLAGEQPVKLAIRMVPEAVISGRVVDSASHPIVNAHMYALRVQYQNGLEILTTAKNALTDDRGEYRIFGLEAGKYYVRSDYHLANIPNMEFRSYFPGVDSVIGALPVAVRAGTDLSATNITVQPTTAVRIIGTVAIPNSSAISPVSSPAGEQLADLYLVPREKELRDSTVISSNYSTISENRGTMKFEFQNVLPGTYDLYAIVRNRPPLLTGHVSINVGSHDLDGIRIVVSPGVDLLARMTNRDDSNRSQMLGQMTLRMRNGIPGQDSLPGRPGLPDGWRVYTGLPEGRYVLDLQRDSLRDEYVSDIRQGGKSIYETGTIVIGSSSPEPIEVIFDQPAGAIDGTVYKSSGKPASGSRVILIPDGDRRENPMLFARANASTNGEFTLRGLAPGTYKLFAWESMPTGAELNADFMKDYERQGIPVTVKAGSHFNVQIPWIPAGAE